MPGLTLFPGGWAAAGPSATHATAAAAANVTRFMATS